MQHINTKILKMRKLIDINEEDGTFERLKMLAKKANKDLKNYIQDLLNKHSLTLKN